MGIIAEIVDLLSNPNREAERATPEKVLALMVRNKERQQLEAGSRKDGKEKH